MDQQSWLQWFVDMVSFKPTPITRALWSLFVAGTTVHIAWACGFLTFAGVGPGFAKADDFATLKEAANRTLQLQLTREIREQSNLICTTADQNVKESLQRYLDALNDEFVRAGGGKRFPEPWCMRGKSDR